ncbi:glycosyltransferase family 4 protein [Brachybacterium sp. AOP24-D1-21]|uniref:glycosyltransferase family 4 protein n=1 Tax=Brachybacterium sp. AOP24-D1-21 TaxID=3457711 RepID=UPI0040335A24
MKIGMLTQWYAPEPGPAALPTELAHGLAARGHDVTVLTGYPNYPTGRLPDGWTMKRTQVDHHDGVTVRRVALYPNHDQSGTKRLLNYASFGASATINGFRALANCDAIWVNYSPVTIGLPMLVTKYLHRVPTVTHVLDLWPDTLMASGFLSGRPGQFAERTLGWWCSRLYAASSSVAYISPSVGNALETRGVDRSKLEFIPMWANEQVFHSDGTSMRQELGIDNDAVVLLYAGTMGGAQGLSSLITAASRFSSSEVTVLLAGSGTHEEELRAQVEAAGATVVRFLGRRPQEQMSDLYATADISYVSLNDHPLARMTMPSKIQASLAAGRAILIAAQGDARKVVLDSGAGVAAKPDDPDSIEQALRSMLVNGRDGLARRGDLARDYYVNTFSLDAGVSRVEDALIRAAQLQGARQ